MYVETKALQVTLATEKGLIMEKGSVGQTKRRECMGGGKMYHERIASVVSVLHDDETIQLLETTSMAKKAILYKAFTHSAKPGDEILVNETATVLALGTGGMDIVKAVLSEKPVQLKNHNGHIMKARYTPIQHSILSVEEEKSPYHDLFSEPFHLHGQPVLLGELHSMVPLAYYVSQVLQSNQTFVAIFDDKASLPLTLSNQLRELSKQSSFHSITIGQAFGGEYEAVSLPTALQFAVSKLKADVVMVSLGPGVVGTGTKFGFSGLCMADWANTIGALGGTPVWIPRLSFQDQRERHYGLSHHTRTALFTFTYAKSLLPIPHLAEEGRQFIQEQLASERKLPVNHEIVFADQSREDLVEAALRLSRSEIKTMGRAFSEDTAFFLAVAEAVTRVVC
ncbi:DUF3866 family protein [Halalkalibacterium halodurans]|uniref:DUF3866 family protein n=1 Tax=Halalkalibacterium halodurans TaxID=86665 RepID=UPI002E20B75C|nr:DUF3866 family protein [Halalkalibacterium halodurans]